MNVSSTFKMWKFSYQLAIVIEVISVENFKKLREYVYVFAITQIF